MQKFVSYLRVSSKRQGESGLGLAAQRKAIQEFIHGGGWMLASEFVEVESGKDSDNRPELQAALALSKAMGAKLVIAKLDRLSRNAAFLLQLRDSGVDFVCADMPSANAITVGVMALVAQEEREQISKRTIAALAAAKDRGVKLGGMRPGGAPSLRLGNARAIAAIKGKADQKAGELVAFVHEFQASGLSSLAGIAGALNEKGILSPRGGRWHASSVKRLLARCAA